MPLPNDELQARYIGIRKNVVPAVKAYVENSDPVNSGRQGSALKQFITEEPDLAGLRGIIASEIPAAFVLSYGIDIGTVLGAQLSQKIVEENTICPQCKDAVVDLIDAARKFVKKVDDGRARSVESYGEFKAALSRLDTTHDDLDGGA